MPMSQLPIAKRLAVGLEAVACTRPPSINNPIRWIGNKNKAAREIIERFPNKINRYIEPFLGSGAVLQHLLINNSINNPDIKVNEYLASDIDPNLIELWHYLKTFPQKVKEWYQDHYAKDLFEGRQIYYKYTQKRFNKNKTAKDFLYLISTCFRGVIQYGKKTGYFTTKPAFHKMKPPSVFNQSIDQLNLIKVNIECKDYKEIEVEKDDLIFLDPPYRTENNNCYSSERKKDDYYYLNLICFASCCKAKGASVGITIPSDLRPISLLNREFPYALRLPLANKYQLGQIYYHH